MLRIPSVEAKRGATGEVARWRRGTDLFGVQGSSRSVSSISASRPAAKDTAVPIGLKPTF